MGQQERVERMQDAKPTNPKDAAATSRLDLSLFPASARAYGALAMTEGDLKYGGYNYRVAGVCVSIYYAAASRHLDKFYNGEWADPYTEVPHLASALACIAVLIDGFEQGNINDDRPPRQDTAGLLVRLQGIVGHLQEMLGRRAHRYTEKRVVSDQQMQEEFEKCAGPAVAFPGPVADACAPRVPEHWPVSVPRAQTAPPVVEPKNIYLGAPEDFLDGWGNR